VAAAYQLNILSPASGCPTFFITHWAARPAQASERMFIRLGKRTDEINQGSANWFLFDREKAAHKSGAVAGPKERYDCVLR
jgi:hypothetical protein